MFCKNCGSLINDNVAVCPNCGTSTGDAQAASQDFRTYSPVWANNADAASQTNNTVSASTGKKGLGGKKKLIPIIIAVVLVVAIVVGIILIATGKKPPEKTLDAAKKTVFESSEMSVNAQYKDDDGEVINGYDIAVSFGEDIDSSTFVYTIEDGDYTEKFEIKNGKAYINGEEEGSLDELFESWENDLSEYFDIDIDIRTELDNILNGKIDEKAVAELFDGVLIPYVEKTIEDETGEAIELPSYDELFNDLEDVLKNETVKEALGLEKTKSDNPGTTYSFNVNFKKLVRGLFEYAQEDKEYKGYLELVADEAGYDDVDELIDEAVDEAEYMGKLKGSVTIKSGKITNITIKDSDGGKVEIDLESK